MYFHFQHLFPFALLFVYLLVFNLFYILGICCLKVPIENIMGRTIILWAKLAEASLKIRNKCSKQMRRVFVKN